MIRVTIDGKEIDIPEHFVGNESMCIRAHELKESHSDEAAIKITVWEQSLNYYNGLIGKYDWAEREADNARNHIDRLMVDND